MKKVLFLSIASLCFGLSVMAQSAKDIKLNAPNKKTGSPFMQALADRASVREFSTKELSVQQLSDLLWAANGVSRADGRRTAPSAMNRQDVDVYVIMKSGAYLYDANNNILKLVAEGDFREYVAGRQTSVKDAPVSLVLVSDLSRFGKSDDKTKLFAAVDVGTVCQNINVFCAATGLATVPRASMDEDKLKEVLKLTDNQLLLMNNPVGYKKD
jgi:SagB-type dehydrogenase family enzyme